MRQTSVLFKPLLFNYLLYSQPYSSLWWLFCIQPEPMGCISCLSCPLAFDQIYSMGGIVERMQSRVRGDRKGGREEGRERERKREERERLRFFFLAPSLFQFLDIAEFAPSSSMAFPGGLSLLSPVLTGPWWYYFSSLPFRPQGGIGFLLLLISGKPSEFYG